MIFTSTGCTSLVDLSGTVTPTCTSHASSVNPLLVMTTLCPDYSKELTILAKIYIYEGKHNGQNDS